MYTVDIKEALNEVNTIDRQKDEKVLLTFEQTHALAKHYGMTLSSFSKVIVGREVPKLNVETFLVSRGTVLRAMEYYGNLSNSKLSPLEVAMKTSDGVVVSPKTQVLTTKSGELQKLEVKGGYGVTEKTKLEVYFRTVVTAALASGVPQHGVVEGKKTMLGPARPEGNIYPAICVPRVQFLAKAYKGATNILDVREKIVQYAKTNGKMFEMAAVICQQIDNETKNVEAKHTYHNLVKCVKETESDVWRRNCLKHKEKGNDQALPTVTYVATTGPSDIGDLTLIQAYLWLQKNRESRGVDKGGVSPLTHGTYYGELGSYYRAVTGSADVLHMVNIMQAKGVQYDPDSYFKAIWPILSLNTIVFRGELGEAHVDQEYGCFKLEENTKALRIYCLSTVPPRMVNGVLEFTPRVITQLESLKTLLKHKCVAVITYGFAELWDQYPGQIWPSLHAHAGTVWVTNTTGSNYSLKDFCKRFALANLVKSYYPYTGQRMCDIDKFTWPSVVMKRSKPTIELDFEVRYTMEPETPIQFGTEDEMMDKVISAQVMEMNQEMAQGKTDVLLAQFEDINYDYQEGSEEEEMGDNKSDSGKVDAVSSDNLDDADGLFE